MQKTKTNPLTSCYRAKTYTNHNIACPKKEGETVIGADIGYSAPKIVSPSGIYSFPSYTMQIEETGMSFREPKPTDIYLRDETGTWAIGERAYEKAGASDAMDIQSEIYGRNWYNSFQYKTLTKAALGIGLTQSEIYTPDPNDTIRVQTGLPAQFMQGDDLNDIKEAFAGSYDFELKIGTGDWERYTFEVMSKNVGVVAQPIGSLMAVCFDKNGNPTAKAAEYFSSNGEIDDYGFGTVDITTIRQGDIVDNMSYMDYGMREILERTCSILKKEYSVSLQISDLQTHLKTGTIRITDKKAMKRTSHSFENILMEQTQIVFEELFEKMKRARNAWQDTDYIIQTGGTYEAWKTSLQTKFKEMDIEIVPGNINIPELPLEFANAWGFYLMGYSMS